ncbi:glycosyl transferase family 1 [Silvimonas iriomotensis]|uniref:Glycosyl transferase family 1 n=2 Tax=Silvimonas iriomotensis TaxID=449662 RepID=A0ABQ2PEL6_9NEIS|nr:glycosyl transferase family 1 [Silvimonas iriomotensis]
MTADTPMKTGTTIYINGRFLTHRLTGVQRFAYELLSSFKPVAENAGYQLIALVPAGATLQMDCPVPVERVGPLDGYAWEQLILPWAARGQFLLNLANMAPAGKRTQLSLVYDAAVWRVPEAYTWWFRLAYRLLLPRILRRSEVVATISGASADDLARYTGTPRSRLTVLRAGGEHIRRTAPDDSVLTRHGLGQRPFVLAVSSLSPNKNFGAIVRALALFDSSGFDFVIAGDTNAGVFADQGILIPDWVKRVGRVSDGQLRTLYEHAALFVFPSFYEGLGLPPLEAMNCGCPVLLSDIPVFREIYAGAAAFCDPYSDQDIAAKIEQLMAQPQSREELTRQGKACAAFHSWQHGAQDLLALLQKHVPEQQDREHSN